jgi:hypothetical protein
MEVAALPRIAFVHIPKTAGTSVTNALASAYGHTVFPGMTTLDYDRHRTEQFAPYLLYKGHAYRRDYVRLPRGTLLFTVFRDPVARAISYYQYYRGLNRDLINDPFVNEAVEMAQNTGVIEFIYSNSPFVIEHLRLGQLRQFMTDATLAEVAHRQFLTRALQGRIVAEFVAEIGRFDYVMTCDYLALHFAKMDYELRLGGVVNALRNDNASVPCVQVSTSDVRRALIDVNGPEFTCYDYVRAREAQILSRYALE